MRAPRRGPVLVIDDDPDDLARIAYDLRVHAPVVLCPSAAAAREAVAGLAEEPLAAVVDVVLGPGPGPDGVDVLHEVRSRYPCVPAVVTTRATSLRTDALIRYTALASPVWFRLKHDLTAAWLEEFVVELACDARRLGPFDREALVAVLRVRSRSWAFTKAEHVVLIVIVRGDSDCEIAAALAISVATVKTHVHEILQKTGHENRRAHVPVPWSAGAAPAAEARANAATGSPPTGPSSTPAASNAATS